MPSDDFTVVFRLRTRASDFLNLVAMPFASPVPVEYLDTLPDSSEFRQRTISNGPVPDRPLHSKSRDCPRAESGLGLPDRPDPPGICRRHPCAPWR